MHSQKTREGHELGLCGSNLFQYRTSLDQKIAQRTQQRTFQWRETLATMFITCLPFLEFRQFHDTASQWTHRSPSVLCIIKQRTFTDPLRIQSQPNRVRTGNAVGSVLPTQLCHVMTNNVAAAASIRRMCQQQQADAQRWRVWPCDTVMEQIMHHCRVME
jgi:hypothetical protein